MAKRPAPNWKELREALWSRSEGFCEVSGTRLDRETFDAHHRRPKQKGGTSRLDTDTLPNLLALDPVIHNGSPQSVHGSPVWARARGYLLPGNIDDAGGRPVFYRGRTWVWLERDGHKTEVTDGVLREVEAVLRITDALKDPQSRQHFRRVRGQYYRPRT